MNVLLFCVLAAGDPFTFRELDGQRLEALENGAPVFVYNYGPRLKAGAPEDRRRSSYLHPVYTPGGVAVTDDFPRDHYHHRGIFWAWPVVRIGDRQADLWTLKGVEHRFEKWLTRCGARLEVENGWYEGGRKIVRETIRFDLQPGHAFDVSLTLEALGESVTLTGSPDHGKGYGGFSCRFGPRTRTSIRTDQGPLSGDEDHGSHSWAELEGTFEGRRAGLRMTAENPGEWCLRQYGFVGASFPGLRPFRLDPGKPLVLRYRVSVYDGGKPGD
ncbi:MAG: PmoA family protein [Acidobacteria bacterium]|nr:PmoA family protein [Acidobacteriota bacterium]